jgi:predicted Zn-dependent peptidase
VGAAELHRARAQVKASLLMSLESTGSRCEQLARQVQVFGRVVPTAETVARIEAVTIADVERAAGRIFRAAPTLAALGPADLEDTISSAGAAATKAVALIRRGAPAVA